MNLFNPYIFCFASSGEKPRTIFDRAMEACLLEWSNLHLQAILNNNFYCGLHETEQGRFDAEGYPLWNGKSPRIPFSNVSAQHLEEEIGIGYHGNKIG